MTNYPANITAKEQIEFFKKLNLSNKEVAKFRNSPDYYRKRLGLKSMPPSIFRKTIQNIDEVEGEFLRKKMEKYKHHIDEKLKGYFVEAKKASQKEVNKELEERIARGRAWQQAMERRAEEQCRNPMEKERTVLDFQRRNQQQQTAEIIPEINPPQEKIAEQNQGVSEPKIPAPPQEMPLD